MRRSILFTVLATLIGPALFTAPATPAQTLQRRVPAKAAVPEMQTMAPSGRIVVKFTAASGLTVLEEGLAGTDPAEVRRVRDLLADKSGNVALTRRFTQSPAFLTDLRKAGQEKVHRPLPDLNAYGVLDCSGRTPDRAELLDLLKEILADPAVETAFLEPRAVPAALGFDAFTGTFSPPEPGLIEDPAAAGFRTTDSRDTPDYTTYQGYLLAPPSGVNAMAADATPGARGADMKLVDIELGWNFDHEDLPTPFFTRGNITSNLDNRNHGTAVMGEIRGGDNDFGVRGIAPEAQVGASSAYYSSVSNAILEAWQAVDQGDVLLIELHAPGPAADGNGQFGYVPMEYWQDNFDAIQVVTANGGIVCEAAGNGTQNLDDEIYGSLFDRDWRDSGAIMCGAATIGGYPYSWSNNGSRVDLNGWGGNVGTCGYGDLQGSPDFTEDYFYTAYFSGTSSASPIVTGSVIALQGMAKANYGFILDAMAMRSILVETGTPQAAGNIVGPRPDIMAAFQNLEWGLGEISGTVTDVVTGLPIAGVLVAITGSDQSTLTDGDGHYSFVTNVGLRTLDFSQFFYNEASGSREVVFDDPAVLDMVLTRLPAVDVRVRARTADGTPLTTCRATVPASPLTVEILPGSGDFLIPGAPLDLPIRILLDNEPFHGVDMITLTPTASPTGYNFVYPELAVADHDFELWWYNYTATTGDWTWGIPTGTPAAFSGEKCWAVGLDGDYEDGVIDYLTSDQYNLSGNEETYLAFHYWSDLEDGVDGVSVQVQSYNNTWIDIEPMGGYSHDKVTALGNKPGWSGASGGWRGAVFDIQEYTDLMFCFRIKFASDSSVKAAGFFIDDVTFDTGDSVSPVDPSGGIPASGTLSINARPNPFNPRTTINWEITRPGPLHVSVYDTRGRLVRSLVRESVSEMRGSIVWDGRDDQGRALASGTYLVQVKDSTGRGRTRRVTLIK